MIRPFASVAALFLAGTACSAQSTPTASGPQGPQPVGADRPVPANAPVTPGLRNVPATSGRANLAPTPPPFAVAEIGHYDEPFGMAFLPDGDLLVTEKAGTLTLRKVSGDVVKVAGIPPVARGGQGGLLGVAVAPDFGSSRAIYLSYAEPRTNGSSLALMRARFDGTRLADQRVIWRAGSDGPGGQFGAKIAFSPDGRYLFLTSGERQRFTPAQDPEQLLGKIVRLTLDGQAAPGNPFADKGPVQAQIWTSGHRNPYGILFTPDGRLWEEEMGPKGGDELNLIEPGSNYGWPVVSNGDNYSGQPIPDHPSRPDLAAPKLWWNPSISPGGMAYYTGTMFPQYRGSLLIGAMSGQGLARVVVDGATVRAADFWDMGTRIRDVAQAPDGAIWLLEDGERKAGGRLLRLTPR
ncbi:PQQ-dependent sugar dehydrogenase [Sphingomonas bacterium]|uniref:PQQ-dependent sugar dehydrogenase n=1 Tax=Sphingomonas bacterium TaxID=1895847 RepID=UPI0015768F9C|nr:PQQ-dependent sugar dehydrogenase [Sphingomonas bacterium]